MENQKYDNKFSDSVVAIIGTIVRTMERSLVLFFDGLRNTVEHANPSLFNLIAVVSPILTPAPVAYMTSESLMTFFQWDWRIALVCAIAIEFVGLVVWVTLVEVFQTPKEERDETMLYFFAAVAIAYELVLVFLNVVLEAQTGATFSTLVVLLLLCLFPAMSAITYGYRNYHAKLRLEQERQEAKAEAERRRQEEIALQERIRQEKRQDRKEAAELKLKYAADTEQVQPFRSRRKP